MYRGWWVHTDWFTMTTLLFLLFLLVLHLLFLGRCLSFITNFYILWFSLNQGLQFSLRLDWIIFIKLEGLFFEFLQLLL